MGMKWLPVVLAASMLAACGTASSLSAPADPARDKLLAAADRAAKANGGTARHVEAVETTRAKAADLDGHSNRDQTEAIWVVQVSGDHYICGACSMPPGAKAPEGDYITMVLRASDYESTDGGMGPRAANLASMGDVEVLRNDG